MTEATRRGAASGSGADLTPFRTIAESVSASGGELVDQVSALIDKAQAFAASQVNATLTLRNWYIGRLIDVAVLREGRAGHDQELVASLGRQLTARYGRGFDRANLYRMVQFSQAFPDVELVASLGQQVSWTHFKALLPVPSSEARAFYVKETIDRRLSVRELRHAIERKAYATSADRCGLKVGKFKPSYQGQMNFYLKWLDRHERQTDENPPIGLILCTGTSREQIELLELHKDGIVVAEYWTTLPPKAELQSRIQAVYREARERIARRQLNGTAEEDDE